MYQLETISVLDLDSYIKKPGCRIIDLRDPEDYRRAHIRGARNLPFAQCLPGNALLNAGLLILYCERGAASMLKAKELSQAGYAVKSVIGGIREYRGKNLVRE